MKASCPIAADITSRNASCNDLNDGAITVSNIRGGVGPYTLRLYDLSISQTIPIAIAREVTNSYTFANLEGGEAPNGRTYYVEIIDNTGCVAQRSALFEQKITKPLQVQVVLSLSRCASCLQPLTVSCANARDGIITVRNPNTGPLGNIPMEFTLLDQNLAIIQVKRLPQDALAQDPTAVSFTGLQGEPGPRGKIYYIRSTYTNPTSGVFCDNSRLRALPDVNIIEPPAISYQFDPGGPVAPVSCNGRSDGIIKIIPTGGTPFAIGAAQDPLERYNYLWSNGAIYKPYINNLASGEYHVTVIDAQGCRERFNFRVPEPKPLRIQSIQVRNLACESYNPNLQNAQVIITVKGGFLGNRAQPAKKRIELYRKDGTGGWNRLWLSGQPAFAQYLIDTTFTFILGDEGGIISSDQLVPGEYRFEIYEDETNEEYKANFRAAYPGNNPAPAPCFTTGFFTISRPAPLLIKAFPKHLSCNIDLVNNLTGQLGPDGLNDPQYYNGRIDIVVSGGTPYNIGGENRYSYKWYYKPSTLSPAWQELSINSLPLSEPQNRSNLRAGIYRIDVTDANGCSSSIEVSLNEPQPFTVTTRVVNPSCANANNGAIHAQVNGGSAPYTYEWSRVVLINPPITNLENEFVFDSTRSSITALQANLPGEAYRLKVIDANGCRIQKDHILRENTPIRIVIDAIKHVKCFNTINPEERGQIKFTVIGGVGSPYYCRLSNGMATSTPEFPTQNEFTFRNLSAGLYTLTVQDANGCIQDINFRIQQPLAFNLDLTVQNKACRGGIDNGSIRVRANGGVPYRSFPPNYARYLYNWYKEVNNVFVIQPAFTEIDSASRISNLSPGRYRVEIIDSVGCIYNSEPILVTEPSESLSISIREIQPITCHRDSNGIIQALAVGGVPPYSYYWVRSDMPQGSGWLSTREIKNLRAGSYTFTVRDANGCHAVTTYTLSEPAPILIQNIITTPASNCQANGTITFSVSAPATLGPLVALLS
ncbi:MAG: SprB repeat-containing protein, partial [Bacteroidia bacterium]|nr:SprB repeat-containing protein [Bacteroidia bacterium]